MTKGVHPTYLRTILIGTLGGLTGHLLNLPLGWLIGSMLTTSVCAMAGVRVPMSWSLRSVMIGVIGLMAGSAFTPDILRNAWQWGGTLSGVAIYCTLAAGMGFLVCRLIARQDRTTAMFSAAPGGLSEIIALGPSYGADVRTLSLIHGVRIAVILALTPIIATALGVGADVAPPRRTVDLSLAMEWRDVIILCACLGVGMWAGRKLGLPAAHLSGPLILSAIVHATGLTAAHPPQLVIIAAQVVIGASVAQFFANTTWRMLVGCLAIGAGLTLVNLALAAGFALTYDRWFDIPFATAFVALVPGGLPEMSLVSIALDLDAAFVSTHHLFRIVLVLIALPILARHAARRPDAGPVARSKG